MSSYSTEILARAQTVIPGGVNSPVRAFRNVDGSPIFFKQGQGPFLIDVDNKKYIDYVCSWGPLVLGHAHPHVTEAVTKAVQSGLGFGAPTLPEVELAELLTRLIPSLEQVRLVCSGTEATQSAIRLARGFTGRDKILKFEGCYHGHVDSLLVKGGSGLLTFGLPDSAGVPKTFTEHTLTAPYNDLTAVNTIFEEYGDSIAAIIVEPVAGNMNCVIPRPHFLSGLRSICDKYKSLLIFDEVITAFRVDLRGAQSLFSVTPDLTCLGKIIGGGLPVGGFGGRRSIMEKLAPVGPVYQAGTLSGNPIAVTAGLATLEELLKPGVFELLLSKTEYFMHHLKQCAKHYSIPLTTHSVGGMFGIHFNKNDEIISYEDVKQCNQEHFKHFFFEMLKQGIYFAPSAFEAGYMSLAHSDEVINQSLEAAERVFKEWPRSML